MAKITSYPIGNGDSTLIDLKDGRKMLVDFADLRDPNDKADKRIDLTSELRANLKAAERNYYDVVAFTHLDKDHVNRASDFFWFDYAEAYQGAGRIHIKELWVPAGALTEVGPEDCAWVIRQEARHRLREGYGIRVFSRPDALKAWFKKEKIDMASRLHLITDAGELVPGYSKNDSGGVEFFIHSPFGFRRNEREVEDRNQDCLFFQATFRELGQDTRILFTSDMPWDGLDTLVDISRRYNNAERLYWDVMLLPHHCSYLSLSKDKGDEKTVPTANIDWLYRKAGHEGAILLSSSWPIPAKGTADDKDSQPPHRQAANYYREIRALKNGDFEVTMERPAIKPRPTVIDITHRGARLLPVAVTPTVALASTPMRAG